MADSPFDIDSSSSSSLTHNSRRYYPSPSNSPNVSFSFTASPSHTNLRVPPTTPFASDHDHSWKEEISWQFEPNEWLNYTKTLGSALSPWASSSSRSGLSQAFRRTANDYYLSRTCGPRGPTTNQYHEHSAHVPNGKIEVQSYAASESDNGFSKLGIIKDGNSGRGEKSSLAEEDELSMIGYNSVVDVELLYSRYDHGSYDGYYSDYENHKVSRYDEDSREGDMEEDEDDAEGGRSVGVLGLFRYSTKWDWVLVIVGSVGAVINGGSLPWYSYLFGDLINKIAAESSSGNKTQMLKDVEQVLLLFMMNFFSLLTISNVWNLTLSTWFGFKKDCPKEKLLYARAAS